MKKINIILAALVVAAASSCSHEEHNVIPEVTGPQPAEELVPLCITTGQMTKTSLQGTTVNWTSDDEVAIFDNVNYPNKFVATSIEGSNAVFEGYVGAGTTDFYAVYPYTCAKGIDASNITVELPSSQTSADGTFAEEHNISVAHGVKALGEAEVEGVKFENVCGLIKFTVPQRIADVKTVVFKAENRSLAGDLLISKDGLKVESVANGSSSVSMSGDFAAGSTFYFVVAPGEVNGFSITVTTQTGVAYSKVSAKSFTVEAAAIKNLGEIDFKAEPTAKAEHSYDNGTLTGTVVTLTPGLPAGMEAYVQNFSASMTKNKIEYRRISSKSSVGTSETMSVVNGMTYIPQGEYVVTYTYTINGVEETKEVKVTVPAPTFTVSASAYTSYSKYLEGNISAANNCAPESMYDIKLTAGISQAVLGNCSMTSNKAVIYKADDSVYTSVTGQIFTKPEASLLGELKNLPWGSYTLQAEVVFDGVTITSPKQTLHITGLPYRAAPPTNSGAHPWAGSAYKWDGSYVRLHKHTISQTFHAPSNVNVSVYQNARIHTRSDDLTYTLSLSGNKLYSITQSSYIPATKTTNVNESYNAILNGSNPQLQISNSYGTGDAGFEYTNVKVYEITVNYR